MHTITKYVVNSSMAFYSEEIDKVEVIMRKCKLLSIAVLSVVVISGCQNNPESSIVKNKDLDKLIEQAKETPSPDASLKPNEDLNQIAEKYDSYKTSINDEKLKVSVNVDAKVDIPKTDKMSVLRVKQKDISQELLDSVKKALLGDKELYDGGATNVQTKADIEAAISELQQWIKEVKESGEDKTLIDEYQDNIDEYQKKYETAPEKVEVTDGKIDGKIHKVSEKVAEGKFNDYYEWQQDLNPDGDVFYGISDASDGWYESLYVQNNKNYANCIRYSKVKDDYLHDTTFVSIEGTNLGKGSPTVCPADEDISSIDSIYEREDGIHPTCQNETVTITEEEALTKAKDLLTSIGIDNFECNESGLFNELLSGESYRKVYIFKFVRTIDGVKLFTGDEKFTDGYQGGEYVKKQWPTECVEVKVNDDGIVEFTYNAPLEVTETVVDKTSMKSFEEIKSIFESMVVVANAQEDFKKNITVDTVKLRYERISEKDSFDTGLLIPAWDFAGTIDSDKLGANDGSVLTINAIDGSVINRELGY